MGSPPGPGRVETQPQGHQLVRSERQGRRRWRRSMVGGSHSFRLSNTLGPNWRNSTGVPAVTVTSRPCQSAANRTIFAREREHRWLLDRPNEDRAW